MRLFDEALKGLKPFQDEDSDFAAKFGRVVFGHKTGMGKSLMALAASHKLNANKVLVLGGKSSESTWVKEPMKWGGHITDSIHGQTHKRAKSWARAFLEPEGIWWTTYKSLYLDMEHLTKYPAFDLIIADELHKIRNKDTLAAKAVKKIPSQYFVGLSATWASRGPQDLWSVMNTIDRKKFSSYWRWVNEYCYVEDTGFGKEIFGIRRKAELRQLMESRYFRTRTWEDIGYQMPPIFRDMIPVRMSDTLRRIYDELDAEMIVEHDGDVVITPTGLAKITRLMQLATLPQLLFPSLGPGPILEHLVEAIEDDPHTVVYTYFTEGIPLIEATLRSAGHNHIYALRGGMGQKKVDEVVAAWKRSRGIMICSIRFAESFRIDTTHTAYVIGFSYDPNENIQAEGRLRALDTEIKSPVQVYYYIVQDTILEAVKDITNEKAMTVSQIFGDYAIFRRSRK